MNTFVTTIVIGGLLGYFSASATALEPLSDTNLSQVTGQEGLTVVTLHNELPEPNSTSVANAASIALDSLAETSAAPPIQPLGVAAVGSTGRNGITIMYDLNLHFDSITYGD